MVDDVMGFRYVIVDGLVEIGDDVDAGLEYFQALRHKHGLTEANADELRAEMILDERVLLIITPGRPQAQWLQKGF